MSEVIHGDCLDVLKRFPDNHFDSVVTDPPYEIGFMGRAWDSSGVAFRMDTWTEVPRVLKPGAHLLAFGATRSYHRMTCAIEDAGFEIRDSLHWIFGAGFPKSKACLKPAYEPVVMARKSPAGTVAANVATYGTGGLNIDGCRVEGIKDVPASPRRAAQGPAYGELGKDPGTGSGWDPNTGRWPPNILLTHSLECEPAGLKRIRNRSGSISPDVPSEPVSDVYSSRERVSWRAHGENGTETVQAWECVQGCPVREMDAQSSGAGAHGADRGTGVSNGYHGDIRREQMRDPGSGGASRFFACFKYQAKAPQRERPKVDGIAHPTCKPLELLRWLVKLVTPPGGMCLDLFAGSGTTGEACRLEGFRYTLIEREADYIKLINKRMSREPSLFDDWEECDT